MPVANCFIAPEIAKPETVQGRELIELWGKCSDKSTEHMTVNLIPCSAQYGNSYAVTAQLTVASVWSGEGISQLQIGLAQALAEYFGVAVKDVIVMTSVVESGFVVEGGEEVFWPK